MKFLCGSCRTKYQISDEKVRGKILTIRCKKCGAKVLVRESLEGQSGDEAMLAPIAEASASGASMRAGGSAAYEAGFQGSQNPDSDDMPTSIAPIPSDAGLAGYEWFVAIDGQQHGPFAFAELVAKVQRREILGRHYVWHDGMQDWTRVRSMPDLAPHLTGHGPHVAPPPAPGEPEGDGRAASMGALLDLASARGSNAPALSMDEGLGDTDEDGADAPLPRPATSVVAEEAVQASEVLGSLLADDELAESDDIFANVPRASAQEVVGGESTKFFVAAAGVPDAAKKIRIGTFLGAAALAASMVVLGLWVTGMVRISLPGIGNPFEGPRETTAVVQSTSGLNDDGNYALLVEGVRIEPAKRKRRSSNSRKRNPRNVLNGLGNQAYVDDASDAARSKGADARLEELQAVSIDGPDTKLTAPEKLTRFEGPAADIAIPPPDVDALDARTIEKVVASKKASVKLCYEQSLKAKEKLEGKLKLLLEVLPSGKVSNTQIVSSSFKGSVVGRCIQRSIRNWRFPRFAGEAQEIELPFVFQRGG